MRRDPRPSLFPEKLLQLCLIKGPQNQLPGQLGFQPTNCLAEQLVVSRLQDELEELHDDVLVVPEFLEKASQGAVEGAIPSLRCQS